MASFAEHACLLPGRAWRFGLREKCIVYRGAVAQAKEIRGISPITAPGYQEMILAALERGVQVSLILTKSVISKIDPDALRAAFACVNFHLNEISDAKVAFTVTDKLVSIALFNLDGSYDPQQDLICEGPEAVRWGKELFEHYLGVAILMNINEEWLTGR
jgi:predicted transcriptional regulator